MWDARRRRSAPVPAAPCTHFDWLPRSIPKGLCPPAQGCEARATLGTWQSRILNPNGVAASVPAERNATTPLGLAMIFGVVPRVVRSASNPGLWGGIPLGFFRLRRAFHLRQGYGGQDGGQTEDKREDREAETPNLASPGEIVGLENNF